MPTVPPAMIPNGQSTMGPSQAPTSPANFLMAAADMHAKGEFQDMPVPKGKSLPVTSKAKLSKRRMPSALK